MSIRLYYHFQIIINILQLASFHGEADKKKIVVVVVVVVIQIIEYTAYNCKSIFLSDLL